MVAFFVMCSTAALARQRLLGNDGYGGR